YLEDLYFSGHDHDSGEKVIAALEYRTPGTRSGKVLERTKMALKGFRRLPPALHIGELEFARCLIFLFRAYLRPNECLGLRVHQLIPPLPSSGTKYWALPLAPEEEATPTKTKEFDESLLLDSPELVFLYPRFSTLKKRSGHENVWSFDYRKFSNLFKRVAGLVGMGQSNLHPYMMRHGGASDDALRQTRSMGAIRRRGRWAADASVKRCEKHARVLKSLECLPEKARDYGITVERQLKALLSLKVRVPAPPGLVMKRLRPAQE
ncbi:unnamed protein product, partial [Prorocentrum cordatum]